MPLRIARRTDARIIKIIQTILDGDEIPQVQNIIADRLPLGADLSQNLETVNQETFAIQLWQITFSKQQNSGQTPMVHIKRTPEAYDYFEFLNPNGVNPEDQILIQQAFTKAFHVSTSEVTAEVALQEVSSALGEELVRISDTISATHSNFTKTYQDLEDRFEKRRSELEAEFSKRKEELEAEFQEKSKKLRRKEEEIDALDARAARRRNRKDLVERLGEVSQSFNLSKDTSRRRTIVGAIFVFLILTTGTLSGFALYSVNASLSDPSLAFNASVVVALLRVSIPLATFVTAIIGVLRWENAWLQQLAKEELRQRQLSIDLQRADWLVEAVQEQYEDSGVPLPDELLFQLSAGLFSSSSKSRERHPLLEVLGDSTDFRLQTGLGEASFNRRGVKRVTDPD